jgi:hypothetical protein
MYCGRLALFLSRLLITGAAVCSTGFSPRKPSYPDSVFFDAWRPAAAIENLLLPMVWLRWMA